jgi:hypothetical protein
MFEDRAPLRMEKANEQDSLGSEGSHSRRTTEVCQGEPQLSGAVHLNMTQFCGEVIYLSRSFTHGCEIASPQKSPHSGNEWRFPGDLKLPSV